MLPDKLFSTIMARTNVAPLAPEKHIREYELYSWLAIVLAMRLVPLPIINDYWAEQDGGDFVVQKVGERFGMSRNRWKEITSIMRFASPDDDTDESR